MKISEQIKIHRKNEGLTQEQVANYLGVSTPAVNKWEKGSTYPDISLLPALARLLKIDMNQLFSFHEELTEQEIGLFINELSEKALSGDITSVFEMATSKIQEYPRCDSLIYMVAVILNGSLTLAAVEETQKKEYENKIMDWLERSAESEDEKVRIQAVYILAAKYIQMQEYDKASLLMERIPDVPVDKVILQANLMLQKQDEAGAAVFLEGNIIQALTRIQSYLYRLLEIEEQTGNPTRAEQIVEIADKMVSLFDMWKYGAVVPHLMLAVSRKDAEQSIRLIRAVLEEAQKPWNLGESPLYYRYPAKKSLEGFGNTFVHALISEIENENQKEYDFLEGNEALKEILAEYKKQIQY
ncbi:MAG: helix-turn-helix transcriptional regulator [Eubacteriales bacterium]|nr:helix-turn-helix transcriptional regulator [Eubacteriales bacterium]